MSVDYERARAEYRKQHQQRQTIIFGGISIVLALLMLLASAWWVGLVPFPFDREFTRAEAPKEVTPCIDPGTASVENSAITVNVYNGTTRNGLARAVANKLTQFDVAVSSEANWGGGTVTKAATIYASPDALVEAYTLRRMFIDADITLNNNATTQVLDVVVGEEFTRLVDDPTLETLTAGQPMEPMASCTEVDR